MSELFSAFDVDNNQLLDPEEIGLLISTCVQTIDNEGTDGELSDALKSLDLLGSASVASMSPVHLQLPRFWRDFVLTLTVGH